MAGVIRGLFDRLILNRRVELVINPKGYYRAPFLGQRRVGLAPSVYVLWGFDMHLGANVLCVRAGPRTTPHGIAGWRLDVTLERRGPIWAWKRIRHDWAHEERQTAHHHALVTVWAEERARKAA